MEDCVPQQLVPITVTEPTCHLNLLHTTKNVKIYQSYFTQYSTQISCFTCMKWLMNVRGNLTCFVICTPVALLNMLKCFISLSVLLLPARVLNTPLPLPAPRLPALVFMSPIICHSLSKDPSTLHT